MKYPIIIRREGKEAAKLDSTPSFPQQAKTATSMEKNNRRQK